MDKPPTPSPAPLMTSSTDMTTDAAVRLKWLSLIALVGQNCTAVLLMSITQRLRDPATDRYSPAAVVFVTEIVKLVFCTGMLLRSSTPGDIRTDVKKDLWPLIVPAMLFALQNNLLFVALSNLEATLFQVTYQMKLLCTALLMVLILNKRLSQKKWIALFVLFAGIVLTQLDAAKTGGRSSGGHDADNSTSLIAGLTAVAVCAFSSGLASVYFEKVLKTSTTGLFTRNVQLSLFSIAIMLVVYLNEAPLSSLFKGFNWLTWILVVNQAVGGLLVAMVMKYADNILKGFATAVAIVVSGLISAGFMGFVPSLQFAGGAGLVLVATTLYSASD